MTDAKRCDASLAVFLINLDRAGDRLLSMQHKLWRMGFRFERVSAIDGAAIEFPMPDFDEFAFRFNRRRSKARGMLFYRLAQQAVAISPVPYRDIINAAGD